MWRNRLGELQRSELQHVRSLLVGCSGEGVTGDGITRLRWCGFSNRRFAAVFRGFCFAAVDIVLRSLFIGAVRVTDQVVLCCILLRQRRACAAGREASYCRRAGPLWRPSSRPVSGGHGGRAPLRRRRHYAPEEHTECHKRYSPLTRSFPSPRCWMVTIKVIFQSVTECRVQHIFVFRLPVLVDLCVFGGSHCLRPGYGQCNSNAECLRRQGQRLRSPASAIDHSLLTTSL